MMISLLSVSFLANALAPQEPSPVPVSPARQGAEARHRVPVHTREVEPGQPAYGLWAAGHDYKASFHDGMTFVPRLGRSYPHNQPFGWQTTSVRIGAHELLTPGEAPGCRWDDWRVEYEHGAVVEAYDVLADGLEQTFVFTQRPAGEGDLCIRGAVTTALWSPATEEHAGGLEFRDAEGRTILTYGRAVAIDADGDRFVMTTSWQDHTIALRLAAADLARADFPLVVDPLLGAGTLIALGPVDHVGDVDVATDSSDGHTADTMTSYVAWSSATDADLHVRLGSISSLVGNELFNDISTTTSCDHPRAAYVTGADRWVIAYQELVLATQQMRVRALVATGNTPAPAVLVPAALPGAGSGVHDWRPVTGGIDPRGLNGGPKSALIVFQRETGTTPFANTADSAVLGVLFQPLAANPWGAPFVIQNSATIDYERPAVNRSAEGALTWSWFVVMQAYDNAIAGDDWDLVGRLVTNTGSVSANSWVSSLGTMHKLGPVVDGRYGRYCVAFSSTTTSIGKTQNIVGTQIHCERLEWSHGAATPSAAGNYPAESIITNTFNILEPCSIAHDGNSRSHWTLAYRSSSTSPALYATRVGYQGKPVQLPDQVYYNPAFVPGVGSVAHNDRLSRTVVAYEVQSSGSGVYWREFVLPVNPPPSTYGTACTPAQLSWGGTSSSGLQHQRWVGSELVGPKVTQAPANSLHLLLLGGDSLQLPISDPILGANCSLLVPLSGPDHFGIFPLAVGSTVQWQLPLPETLPAMSIYLQDWILDPADNLLRGTSGLLVPLAK
ncbi:MAG: hypothetical protein MUC36_00285 [Planctomycetes bacterium]|nr:hypothetical protein [Planctomycetota bacterium]